MARVKVNYKKRHNTHYRTKQKNSKHSRRKPKGKAKRFRKYAVNKAKTNGKRKLKKHTRKAKEKLHEMDTTESSSISRSITVGEKTLSGTNSVRKTGVGVYKNAINRAKIKTKNKDVGVERRRNRKKVKGKNRLREKSENIKGVKNPKFDNSKKAKLLKIRKYAGYKGKVYIKGKISKETLKTKDKLNKVGTLESKSIGRSIADFEETLKTKDKFNKVDTLESKSIGHSIDAFEKTLTGANNLKNAYSGIKKNVERKKSKKRKRLEKMSKDKNDFLKNNYSNKANVNSDKGNEILLDKKPNDYLSKEKNLKGKPTIYKSKARPIERKTRAITNKNAHIKKMKKESSKAITKKSKVVAKKTAIQMANVTSKAVVKLGQTTSKATSKALASLLSNPYALIALGIILALAIIFSILSSILSIGSNVPDGENDIITYLVEQLAILDTEANEYIESIDTEEDIEVYRVDYIYNSSKEFVYSSPKEFIIYLMLVDDNVITMDSITTLKEIHEKSYNIEYEIAEGVDEESGEYIQALEVTLTIYTFEEMLEILGLRDEQKERALEIQQLPFNDIFTDINFNEAGKGLTQAEINELMKDLPSSTPKREKLRDIAFTLVDYTVYDWGGKASGTIARPTGLDCSGFVAWVYDRAGFTRALQGGGTTYQWGVTTSISYSQIQVGDLGFQHDPNTLSNQGNNHVGMYIGNGLWVECYSSHGVGVTSGNVFKYYRRVNDFNE